MELNKIKKQVDNAEATKAKAISELKSAKEILQNLITKLANVIQCKQSTTAAAQVERNRSRRFDKTTFNFELIEATKTLQDIVEEKNSLKKLMFCLRKYLNQVQKEQGEVKGKKHAAEAIAANLTVELQNSREKSRPEPFKLVLVEAKDAKAAEERPVKEINILSEAKECEDLVEKKETIVMAELQQIYAKKNEVDRKVETNLNAIKETKAAIETALWSAEMADSAKAAIEIELFRLQVVHNNFYVSPKSSQANDKQTNNLHNEEKRNVHHVVHPPEHDSGFDGHFVVVHSCLAKLFVQQEEE
ncbi:hypothetical protein Fmac_021215 [Flemingia macrophylla]|uniref:Uncharacterized protein n=1 Tax=Flemingia macrophylla TaxID=520843 RepID=A0ABD1LW82_9FABA